MGCCRPRWAAKPPSPSTNAMRRQNIYYVYKYNMTYLRASCSSTQPQEHLIVDTGGGETTCCACTPASWIHISPHTYNTYTQIWARKPVTRPLAPGQTIHDLPRWQPTLHATSENTATAPGHLVQTSDLQACLPSLRPSPRPLHEDRRIYRGREYNTGGHSEGGNVVPPGITTSDRGGQQPDQKRASGAHSSAASPEAWSVT